MPAAATGLDVSSDGQYIFAAGVYKPRVRCYDVNHLSMKFERCVDSEIVDLFLLSEDYTKVRHSPPSFHTLYFFVSCSLSC